MTKKELVAKIASEAGIAKVKAEIALNAALEGIKDALAKGDKVSFVGFGTFNVVKRSARKGRNPKTNEVIDIPQTTVVRFKPGKELKDAVK
ncbi:HU family DNA-binding protein [bacterium]|nr:HU family DNA-binding protein [candidate division CSSED10-310 bacterium]